MKDVRVVLGEADIATAQLLLVLVEGAGHMVNVTHPRKVSAALLRLLDAVQRREVAGEQRRGEAGRGPDRRA